jgi:hypothetical protein
MRTRLLAVALGATGCLLGTGSAVLAANTPRGGGIRVFSANPGSSRNKILITGAIGDYGTEVSVNAHGKVDPNGNFEKVALKHGSFLVNATALNEKLSHSKPIVNPSNCSVVFSGSGPVTIGVGTGAYTGITGRLMVTLTFAGIAPKTAHGCNLDHKLSGEYQSLSGSGTVSFN